MTDTLIPLPAATIVLMRPESSGFSVLMMQRPSKSSFMGGMHVFPGGKCESSDTPAAASALGAALAPRMGLSPIQCDAYVSAACREAFEEMGVLVSAARPLDECRRARTELEAGVLDWSAWHGALGALDVVYFDHWITPEIEPKRFDTRFFAARVPPGCEPEPNAESVAWGFFRPEEALEKVMAGVMQLAPPTLVTLQRLTRFGSLDEALEGLAERTVGALQPCLAATDPISLALPGHPAHPVCERISDNPTLFKLVDGRWHVEW